MQIEDEATAGKAFEEANELMANDLFEKACEVYTSILECGKLEKTGGSKVYYDSLIRRSEANTKLAKYTAANQDAQLAIEIKPEESKGYLKKGIAEFNLDEINNALGSFEKGQTKVEGSSSISSKVILEWIEKCKDKMPEKKIQPAVEEIPVETTKTVPTIPKVKHEWYQSESNVTITIFAKNIKATDVQIEKESETQLKISSISESNLPVEINFNFTLSHAIVPDQTQVKFLSTKIEIKLKKQESVQWKALESEISTTTKSSDKSPAITTLVKQIPKDTEVNKATTTTAQTTYPTSSKNPKNWDKIAADVDEEEKNQKDEGDSALNKLFQQVYANGNDETRKAMNKSFSESGGTVLSTNWSDVGTKKQDIKAPDGMEWKKWD